MNVIRKWLPSDQRTRAPGAHDSLDVQIQTDEGPRDLRMRCADTAAVHAIMADLQAAVQAGVVEPCSHTQQPKLAVVCVAILCCLLDHAAAC